MGRFALLSAACFTLLLTACGSKGNNKTSSTTATTVNCTAGHYSYDQFNNVWRNSAGQIVNCTSSATQCASYTYDPFRRQFYNRNNNVVTCNSPLFQNGNIFPFNQGCQYMTQYYSHAYGISRYFQPMRIYNQTVCVDQNYYNQNIYNQFQPLGYWGNNHYPVYNYSCFGGVSAQANLLGVSLGICAGGGI